MSLKFAMILEAVDRASAPLRRVQESAKRLAGNSGLSSVKASAARATRGLDRLRERTLGANSAFTRFQRTTARMRSLGTFGNMAEHVGRQVGSLTRRMAGLSLRMAKWTGVAAIGGAGLGLKSVVATASEFEKYQTMLETVEGSQAKAKSSMAWVTKFAVDTPYELGDVMDSFVRLKAYGIDPTSGALRSVGDAAAGMNTSLMQAVEALADAQTGEFERLKEFGITTAQAGDKVTFAWNKNGKAMTTAAKKNAREIQSALMSIFDARFGGGMNKLSGTFDGMMNNLKDKFTSFKLMIANAGLFDSLKNRLGALLDRVNAMAADGRLQVWAENISAKLTTMSEKAFDFIEKTDWGKVTNGIMSVAHALAAVVKGMTDVMVKTRNMGLTLTARIAEKQENSWFATKEARERGRKVRQEAEREIGYSVTKTGREDADAQRAANSRALSARTARDRRSAGLRPMARGAPPMAGRAGLAPVRSAADLLRAIKPQPVQVGGKVGINVKASPELTARLDRIESLNRKVPVEVATSAWGGAALRGLAMSRVL